MSAWKLLDGLPGGRGYNIAHEAVDRHAQGARGENERRELTYRDLAAATNRFANALPVSACKPGERVFVLMGRTAGALCGRFGRAEGALRRIAAVFRLRT
jgi:acetyl-CoA synthetase